MCVSVLLPRVAGVIITCSVRRMMLSTVACLHVPHFSTLSHNVHDYQKTVIVRIMCIDYFCNFCLKDFTF
jgi:hypothetical protein